MILIILIPLVVCVYSAYLSELPPYIKPCSVSSADFDDCCLQHAKTAIPRILKGDRKFNIPSFSPLVLPSITLQAEKGLNLVLKDVSLYGMDTLDLQKIKFNLRNQEVYMKGVAKHINILGKYDIDSNLLLVPIQGNGDLNTTAADVEIKYDMKYIIETINGKDYLVPKNGTADFQVKSAAIQLDNLFNGNKELGEATNRLLNEDIQQFIDAIKPGTTEVIVKVANNLITGFTSVVPFEQMFLK